MKKVANFLFFSGAESVISQLLMSKINAKDLFVFSNFAFVTLAMKFSKHDRRLYLGAGM